jgi:hypothetical protein
MKAVVGLLVGLMRHRLPNALEEPSLVITLFDPSTAVHKSSGGSQLQRRYQ